MLPFYSINRYILLTRPSQALVNWVNKIFPDDPISYEDKMLHDNTNVYLIPEMDTIEEAEEWLKENCLEFLENILEEWCTDSDEWPEKLDWIDFQNLIDFTIQSNVMDVISEEEDDDERAFDDDDDFDDDVAGFAADKDEEIDWE